MIVEAIVVMARRKVFMQTHRDRARQVLRAFRNVTFWRPSYSFPPRRPRRMKAKSTTLILSGSSHGVSKFVALLEKNLCLNHYGCACDGVSIDPLTKDKLCKTKIQAWLGTCRRLARLLRLRLDGLGGRVEAEIYVPNDSSHNHLVQLDVVPLLLISVE